MGKYTTFIYGDGTKYGIGGPESVVTIMYEDINLNPIHAAKVGVRHSQTRLVDGTYISSGLAEPTIQCSWRISSVTIFEKISEIIKNEKFGTIFISHPLISRYEGIWNISQPNLSERNYLIWELKAQLLGPMKRWRYHWFASELFTDYDNIRFKNTSNNVWDFEGGTQDTASALVTLHDWEMILGTWTEADNEGPSGVGDNTIQSPNAQANATFVFGQHWISDMSMQFQLKIETGYLYGGCVFRFKDTGNQYRIVLDTNSNTVDLIKIENSSPTTLRSYSATIDVEIFYLLKVETIGNHFQIFLDGILIIDYYDNTFTTGRSGFYADSSDVFFDNLYYSIKKPVRIGLPAGYIGVNQGVDIVERKTSRDILAAIIDPISPITFAQRVKSLPQMDGTTELLLHLDEGQGSTVYDASGNGLTGSITGATWAGGENKWFRKCLSFDATSENITITDNPVLDFTESESFSISFWFYPGKTGSGTVALISKLTGGIGYWVRYNLTDGKVSFKIEDGSLTSTITSDNGLSEGVWHYIVVVRNISTDKLNLYIDGVSAAAGEEDFTTGTLTNAQNLYIQGTSTAEIKVDEIEIRRSVITASEIATNWTNRNIGLFGGGDVLLWDVDADTRVYHWDHEFNNHVDIINGLIKLRINEDDGYIYLYGFETGAYLAIGKIRFRYYLVEESTLLNSENASSWSYKIREVSPDRVVIRIYHDFDNYGVSGTVDFILQKGSRHVLFDFSMNGSRITTCAAGLLSLLDYRFIFAAQPEGDISLSFFDAEFDSTANILSTRLEDNFIIAFEESVARDILIGLFCTDDPTLAFDSDNVAPFGQEATSTKFDVIKAYTEKRQCGFILTPFDTSSMFQESEDATLGGTADTTSDGSASNSSVVVLDASGESVYYSVSNLPPGAYTAYFRLKYMTSGTVVIDVYNDSDAIILGTRTVVDPSATFVIVSVDFFIDKDDDGDTIQIRATWSAGTIRVDYQGFIPLADSKNFTGDIAHQALRKVKINRSGEMD